MKTPERKITAEAVEFLPDAIEIKNEKLPLWARYSVIFSLIFFLGAILWASLGKVDVVVKANGKITSDKQNIVMKPRESSIVKKIHIRVGDIVEKDDLLITFDPTINGAEVDRIKQEIRVLEAKFNRFMAENGGKIYQPAELTLETVEELNIFKQRRNYFESRMKYFEEAIKQLDASLVTKKDSIATIEEQLKTVRKMEKMYEGLASKKAVPIKDLWNVQVQRIELEGNRDTYKNNLDELSHQRQSIISQKDSFIHEWHNSISENMIATGRELDRNRKQLAQAKTQLSFVELRAPSKAVVHEIAPFPEGSAVGEAEAIITLVPLDGNMEVEAMVEPRNRGKVTVGAESRVKLSAYPFQKYGTLNGTVRQISEDTVVSSTGAGVDPETGAPRSGSFYRTRVTLGGTETLRNLPDNFRLIPGMEVEVEIKTGRRRIIEYIIYPLIKALDETAREP